MRQVFADRVTYHWIFSGLSATDNWSRDTPTLLSVTHLALQHFECSKNHEPICLQAIRTF